MLKLATGGLLLQFLVYQMGLDWRKSVLGGLRTTHAQTRQHIRAVWSAPLLFTFRKLVTGEISIFYLVFVAEETGFRNPKGPNDIILGILWKHCNKITIHKYNMLTLDLLWVVLKNIVGYPECKMAFPPKPLAQIQNDFAQFSHNALYQTHSTKLSPELIF